MSKFNAKSILARLLARENIDVQQNNHPTAFFDVENRVLGLPYWKDMTDDTFDLFVSHEVGHALHTPAEGWHSSTTDIPGCPRSYVNIVEDIRIEKLIIREFPGLLGSYMRGYKNLLDRDFFLLSEHPIETLGFMDRLNIHAKSRGIINVPFSPTEQAYVDEAMGIETWEDTIAICRKLYEFVKHEIKAKFDQKQLGSNDASDSGVMIEIDSDDVSESGEPITDEAFTRSVKNKLLDVGDRTVYVKAPTKEMLDDVIIPYAKVKAGRIGWDADINKSKYIKEQASIKKAVDIMIREFEMKKAAKRFAKARQSTTGSIDLKSLHRYKFDDNIFKVITSFEDDQSHGLMMLIDYSGSMSHIIRRVLRQVLILTTFCKRANIPFEVYGFTNPNFRHAEVTKSIHVYPYMASTSVFELISSSMNKKTYDEAYVALYSQYANGTRCMGRYETMQGTPLLTSIIALYPRLMEFRAKHNVKKMSFITLTDGASDHLTLTGGYNSKVAKTVVLDICGQQLKMDKTRDDTQRAILNGLRSAGITTINYHIIPTSQLKYHTKVTGLEEQKRDVENMQQKGVHILDNTKFGYDRQLLTTVDSSQSKPADGDFAEELEYAAFGKKRMRLVAEKFAEIIG